MVAGRGLNFRHDDWEVMEDRFRGGISSFLEPLNEHLSIVPIAVYRVLFHTAGLGGYFWFRLVLAAFELACGYCVWILLRRRVSPALAVALTGVLVFCGAAYENFIFPIQIGQVGSLLGGLVAWVMLERDSRWGTAAVIAAVAFSLASSAIGVAVLAGVGIEVLMRRQWARLLGVGALAALFLIWYGSYGHGSGFFDFAHAPSFLAGIAAYTLTGALGLWPLYHLSHGLLIAAAAVIALAIVSLAALSSRLGWLSTPPATPAGSRAVSSMPRVAGLVVMLAVYWGLTSVARAGLTPYRSRYMHPGAIVLVLALAELLRGRRLGSRATGVVVAACAGIAVLGVPYLLHNGAKYRESSAILSAQVGALELARADAPAAFRPAPTNDPQIQAGPLFRVERSLGSSLGDPPARILQEGAPARAAADQVLLRLSSSLLTPIPESRVGPCAARRTADPRGVAVAAGQALVIRNDSPARVEIGLDRFSEAPIRLAGFLRAGQAGVIRTEADGLPRPWRLYAFPAGQVRICTARSL